MFVPRTSMSVKVRLAKMEGRVQIALMDMNVRVQLAM